MPSARPRPAPPDAPSCLNNDLARRFKQALRNPGQLEAFHDEAQAEAKQAAAFIESDLKELRAQLKQVDPLRTLGALHVFDAIRRDMMPSPSNFGSDAMLDLLATVICSEAETTLVERIGERFEPGRLWKIEQVLKRIGNHMATAEAAWTLRDRAAGHSTPLLSMLRLENTFDRMAGFDPHVRRVVEAVFSRVDERVKAKLGFTLSGSLHFASLYAHVRLVQADRAEQVMDASDVPSSFPDRDQELLRKAGHMCHFALNAAPPVEGGPFDKWLAERLGLNEEQFSALVTSMATNLGSVDPERVLQDSSVRTRPLIQLSSGEWMWARPIDFLHGAMEWALGVCKADPSLNSAFDAARQSIAEELTADLLEEVFGRDHVFRNVRYPDTESDAENDTIVSLPGLTLLVETKGGRFSAPGRRAAPLRVEKHAKELVEDGAKQNRRTAAAIADGKILTAKDGRRVPVDPLDDVLPIVLTLDRVDPFSTYLGQPPEGGADERNWVVNLADLVMLADILPIPEEFVAYARRRLRMLREGVRVFVEADCLGHWCEDRTAKIQKIVDPSGRGVRMVGETSDLMNEYFTQVALREFEPESLEHRPRVDKPTTGIPSHVLRSLEAERVGSNREWASLVDRVASVSPKAWRPVIRLLNALERTAGRKAGRELRKRIRKSQGGLTIDGQVVVTLASVEPLSLEVTSNR
jgi:hypothetical protein